MWGRPASAGWKLTFNVNIKCRYPSTYSHFTNASTETCLTVFGDLLLVNEWCHELITPHFMIKHGNWNNHTCRVLCLLSLQVKFQLTNLKFTCTLMEFKQSSNASTQFQHSKKSVLQLSSRPGSALHRILPSWHWNILTGCNVNFAVPNRPNLTF